MNNNEFNNIEIPKEIDLFIKNGLNKAIIDKKRRKNKIAKMAISASIMGAIFTGFSLNVIAQRMPFLNNVFEELKNNKVTIKDMLNGTQEEIYLKDIISYLQKLIHKDNY